MHKRAFSESIDSPASRAHTRAPSLEAPLPGVACSNSSRDQKRSLGRSADKCGCVCGGGVCGVCGVCVGCAWGVPRGVCGVLGCCVDPGTCTTLVCRAGEVHFGPAHRYSSVKGERALKLPIRVV